MTAPVASPTASRATPPTTSPRTWRALAAGRLPVFLAGAYCVAATVTPVGFASGAPAAARVMTWISLVSLPIGLLVPSARLALWASVYGVLGGAVATFGVTLAVGRAIPVTPLGVLGFFALALAFGAPSSPAARQGVGQGVRTDWLAPRRAVSGWQIALASLVVLASPLLLLLPLGLDGKGEAIFALVSALGAILLVLPRVSDLLTRLWLRRL